MQALTVCGVGVKKDSPGLSFGSPSATTFPHRIGQFAASAGAEMDCLIRCTQTVCQRTRIRFSPNARPSG